MDKLRHIWSKTNRWHRVIVIFAVVELRLLPGGQLGFQCNDPALSHPYTGDTVSWKWLMGVTVFLPLLIMLLIERLQYKSEEAKQQALRWYKEYLFGLLLNLTIVQTLKLVVGSPRPHFFDTCRPKESVTCQGSEYVSSYTCTKAHWLNQSDKSFPSGHTSLAVHAAVFLMYYLQRRVRTRTRTLRTSQLLLAGAAVYCSVSRMTDHRHHWWDVLAGAAIAAPVLLYTILTLCSNFVCIAPVIEQPTEEHQNEVTTKLT